MNKNELSVSSVLYWLYTGFRFQSEKWGIGYPTPAVSERIHRTPQNYTDYKKMSARITEIFRMTQLHAFMLHSAAKRA